MEFDMIFKRVLTSIENYDITKVNNLSELLEVFTDKEALIGLQRVYSDLPSLCSSPEFSRLKAKYIH